MIITSKKYNHVNLTTFPFHSFPFSHFKAFFPSLNLLLSHTLIPFLILSLSPLHYLSLSFAHSLILCLSSSLSPFLILSLSQPLFSTLFLFSFLPLSSFLSPLSLFCSVTLYLFFHFVLSNLSLPPSLFHSSLFNVPH
jgi:hypothetical protein